MADIFIIRTPSVGQLSKHKERELISIISYRYLIPVTERQPEQRICWGGWGGSLILPKHVMLKEFTGQKCFLWSQKQTVPYPIGRIRVPTNDRDI